MHIEMRKRRVRSEAALLQALDGIEAGEAERPDWLVLEGRARLHRIDPRRRQLLLPRLHACVRRGFRSPLPSGLGRRRRLGLWREIAGAGFHDFASDGFSKCYDSPFVESYDYVGAYLDGGLAALDPFEVYSAVLGTHDYSVEDLVHTRLCAEVRTVIEPMAGSAEFAYRSHFHHPDFRYVLFDLDGQARRHVLARRWLPETEHHYLLADVLDEEVWRQAKTLSSGPSLCYLGKQSHHFFRPRDLFRLMRLATECSDFFVLEVPPPTLLADLPETDDLSRPEMEDAGFGVALVDLPGRRPNEATSRMGFRLEAYDPRERRILFEYRDWTFYQLPTLVALAELLDLQVGLFHGEECEFVPVERGFEGTDLGENIGFIAFTRHRERLV